MLDQISSDADTNILDTPDFLALANRSSGAIAEQYRLLALKQSILKEDYQFASQLYPEIDISLLSATELDSLQLSHVALVSSSGEKEKALANLLTITPRDEDKAEWNYYMGWLQESFGNSQTATTSYYACTQSPATAIAFQNQCTENLWGLLLESEANHSQSLAATDKKYKAWTELAKIIDNNNGLIEHQTRELDNWYAANSEHPARERPPSQLLDLIRSELEAPLSVALVLPLSGRLQAAGEAVLDGFLSATFKTASEGYLTPEIEIFDSAALPLELIAELIANGSFDMVIGPLDAENVQAFTRVIPKELPTLFLNSLPTEYNPSPNQLGYSLAVESEAHQAAQTAIEKGYKNALVIIEDSGIGERAAGAFAENWLQEDRQIYDMVRLSDATTLTQRLEQSFHVDQSEQRKTKLQSLLGKALEFTPRRRQDIDTIFLASNSTLAKQVTPTLAFLFAQDVPVLATSRVFDENSDPEDNRDLAALEFLSPPWQAREDQPLEQAESSTPLELQKLEAMGVDAFYLSRRFRQFEDPGFRYRGKTGNIFLGRTGSLSRTMEWVRIDGDKMVLVQ